MSLVRSRSVLRLRDVGYRHPGEEPDAPGLVRYGYNLDEEDERSRSSWPRAGSVTRCWWGWRRG